MGPVVSPTAIAYAKVHREYKRELSFRTPDWSHVEALEQQMLVISEEQRVEDWQCDMDHQAINAILAQRSDLMRSP